MVEGTSGRPIELFELLVERDTGGEAPHRGYSRYSNRKPRPEHHENGEVELAARPGLDRFLLTVPGHARVAGEIEETEVQIIRLLRGARLTGRVLRDGAVVEGAHVALGEGFMSRTSVPAKEGTWPPHEQVFRFRDVGKYEAWTDADGRFEIVGYSDGIHGLIVRDEQGAPLALAPLHLNEEKDRDVGDLELPVGASIIGSVTVAAGLRVGGIVVNLDDWKDHVDCITDDKGQFRFDDLAPGRHTIDVAGVSGLLADGPELVLDLVDGETRELSIDLTRRALGRVQVLVTENGEPREGWQVLFIPVADIGDLSIDYQYNRFGQDLETDSEGYARGWAPAGESHYIEIHRPGAANFTHPTATITPRIDSAAEVECDFSFGSVRIVLPDDFAPEGNEYSLSLVSANGEGGRILLQGFIKPEGLRVLWTYIKGPFQLDSIPVGEYRIYMDTYDLFASARKKLQDTGVPEDQRESFSTAEPIRIRAGVVTEIRLRR